MMQPTTEAQLAEAVRDATGPLSIRGGGTRHLGNPVTGEVLSTTKLSGISLYEPGALTIVAQAGTPLVEIEAALTKENQRLPFEPMDHRALLGTKGEPTIGGIVAANVSGPRRIQAGACRDSLIGLRFVDGLGTAVKNGGRVMKNVTGYDLVKLLAGSYGTLGVLSEVSFKLLPGIATQATLIYYGMGWTGTTALMSAAMGSPFEVSGAGRLPAGTLGPDGAVVLRLEGFADSVAYRTKALSDLLSETVGAPDETVTDKDQSLGIWAKLRDVEPFSNKEGDVWRISVKPSDLVRVGEALGLGHEDIVVDWAGGLIWVCVPDGTDLRPKLANIGGHATLIRASDATKSKLGAFHPEVAPIQAINAGLRSKFDPRGILNPGLMG